MKLSILLALVTIITVVGHLSAFAQTGTIVGAVETADGQAAVNVNVGLKGTAQGASTDENGQYKIYDVAVGSYVLVASSVGLEPKEIKINVVEGKTTFAPAIALEESKAQLQEITVRGARQQYVSDVPSRSLRLQTPLLETPQNIQVVTREVINDQQTFDMLETVTRNVSGAQMIEHWGNFARVNIRGFNVPAFRNGMNVQMPWGPLSEDMAIVERIEFVKGPAGFLLSSGEPGGLYNVVTKKPVLNQPNEMTLTTGSFNTLRATVDLGGTLTQDDRLLYRFNAMGLTKGAHRDYEFNNRYTFAPSLSYALTDRTSVTAEYIYQYSQMSLVGAAYVFSPNGFGDLPRDFTLAEPNIDPTDIHEHNVFVNLNHKINDQWELTAQLGYLYYEQEGSSLWADSVRANGDIYRTLSSFDGFNESKLGQVFVNGNVRTGAIGHKILVGLDLGQKDYFADWWQTGQIRSAEPFNIYNPQYGVPADSLPTFSRERSIRQRATSGSYPAIIGQRYSSVYLQDELSFWADRVRLTLAGRYTSYRGWSYGNNTDDQVVTPRIGLSVSIDENTSVYGLYDQSFIPQVGADTEGNAFVPVRAKNIEAGIKRFWASERWNSTLGIYQITKDNVLTTDPGNPLFSIQLGQVQSTGLEFDIQGEIVDGLQLVLNYANTNVEVTEDTNEALIGNRVAGHARHMTNGWVQYQFRNTALQGFGVSLGYQYQVNRSSWNWGADNESMLPDYFRLDGAVSWRNDNVKVGLNINNLLNDYLYSGSSYGTYYYWQSEPGTNFRLNVAYTF